MLLAIEDSLHVAGGRVQQSRVQQQQQHTWQAEPYYCISLHTSHTCGSSSESINSREPSVAAGGSAAANLQEGLLANVGSCIKWDAAVQQVGGDSESHGSLDAR
jgi:hypothetical protein